MSVNETRIHIVYLVISKLLSSLMSKFVKSEFLRGDSNNVKSLTELLTLNIKDNKNCKPLILIDIIIELSLHFLESWGQEILAHLIGSLLSVTFSFEIDIAMGINKVKKCFLSWPRKERMKGPWMLQSI